MLSSRSAFGSVAMSESTKASSAGTRRRWDARIQRARELQAEMPNVREGLRLYEAILNFQMEVALSADGISPSSPLREQIDIPLLCAKMPKLLKAVVEAGPEALVSEAERLRSAGPLAWEELLRAGLPVTESELTPMQDFFSRACLQPMAEQLQLQIPQSAQRPEPRCPGCGGVPQMSILRTEGEGASRWLMCCFCLREWLFRRLMCPWCQEENRDKLPRYSAEEYGYVHIEGCDTCKRYLKTVDLSVNGRAVPLVDEATAAVLDVWAVDHGYQKIVRNLIGF